MILSQAGLSTRELDLGHGMYRLARTRERSRRRATSHASTDGSIDEGIRYVAGIEQKDLLREETGVYVPGKTLGLVQSHHSQQQSKAVSMWCGLQLKLTVRKGTHFQQS